MAAGTVTATEITHPSVRRIKFAWTSGTAGDEGKASGATTAAFTGKILGLGTVPDAVAAPAINYDITVTDADGLDVLLGAGANRSDSATEYVAETSIGAVSDSKLTINVTSAGASKKGTAYLWIR